MLQAGQAHEVTRSLEFILDTLGELKEKFLAEQRRVLVNDSDKICRRLSPKGRHRLANWWLGSAWGGANMNDLRAQENARMRLLA